MLGLRASPAHAQIAATATVQSDSQFRGHSVSEGRPVLGGTLSYDHASGVYANVSVMAVLLPDIDPRLLSAQGGIGYSKRLASGPAVDLGIVHTEYSSRFSGGYTAAYSEIYAGLITRRFSTHVHYSPDYLRRGVKTVYGEVEGVIHPLPKLRLTAHVGLLTQLAGPRYRYAEPPQYDVQLGVGRRFGSLDLHAAWSIGGLDRDDYARPTYGKRRFVVGATYTF